MADKADNENQGIPASGERRAALRSDESGGGSTRIRESGFPMRKASTLPDVSAYSGSGGTTPAATTSAETTPDNTLSDSGRADDRSEKPAETEKSAVTDQPADSRDQAAPTDADTMTATGPVETASADSDERQGDERHGSDTGDRTTADPSSLATQQIAATPVAATPAGSTATGSTAAGSTAARSTRAATDDDAAPDTSALTIRPPEEDVSRRANQRDEAAAAKPLLPRILQVVVAVFFPIILLAAAVRAVTTPLFLWIEYNRPGFPADSYGFSTEDRMTYGSYTMDYILNWAPARYLGDLVNTDGDQLFLDSEVGHMADVKGVLSTGFVVATVLAILAILACIYLARRYPGGIRRALFAGAVATLVLAIALAVAGVLAWETFFTQVHALLFADGTWTFRLDDTLIRLFPAQFWIDAAASVGAIVLIGAVLTLVFTWPTKARREKSADAYAARRANSGI